MKKRKEMRKTMQVQRTTMLAQRLNTLSKPS